MLNNHKKLIVFDLNLDWKQNEQYPESKRDSKLISSLLQKANEFQTVVLTTSGCFFDAVDFVTKKNINKGYLIANGGSIIYDLAQKKILAEYHLQNNDLKALFHHGYTMGLNIAFATRTNKYMYVSNSIFYEKIKNKTYSPYTVIKDYKELTQILNSNEILDLGYLSTYESGQDLINSLQLYNVERFYDNEKPSFSFKVNSTSVYIHFGSVHSTKYKAIQSVMAFANVDSFQDVLYIASTCCNKECYLAFKNTLIASDPKMLIELQETKKHRFICDEINNLDDKLGLESDNFWK